MKDSPIFTNSTEVYDLLKPLGYDVTFLDAAHVDVRQPGVVLDEINEWVEKRGGWANIPRHQSERPPTITVWSGHRGSGVSLFMAAEVAHRRNLWGDT